MNDIIQFLVLDGFLINRLDLSVNSRLYWELTEKGKDLKELGDWLKYGKLMQIRKAQKYDPIKTKSSLAFWIRYTITIIVWIAACIQIIGYAGKIRNLSPLELPGPYFVCTWLFLIFMVFWMHRQNTEQGSK